MIRRFIIWSVLAVLVPVSGIDNAFAEKKGNSVTSVSFGSYQETDGEDTITGSQLAIAYLKYFTDQWAYFVRLSNGSASGTHTEGEESTEISSSSTALTGGLQWSYAINLNDDQTNELVPYVGGGISVQRYRYEFDYEGTEIGKTSGTGYGPLFMVGLKINISNNFIIIPGYSYQQTTIETESGESRSMVSSGTSIALVARF